VRSSLHHGNDIIVTAAAITVDYKTIHIFHPVFIGLDPYLSRFEAGIEART
jgi:hypothetical protein